MQSFFVQQDAVFNLAKSFDLEEDIEKYSQLKDIRELRNNSVGHPTKRDGNKKKNIPASYHFIVKVNVRTLMNEQEKYISTILNNILDFLKKEDEISKENFRDQSLSDIFNSKEYLFEKLYEPLHPLNKSHFKELQTILENFIIKLDERGIKRETYDSISCIYSELEYPLEVIKNYLFFDLQANDTMQNAKNYDIHLFF